RCLRARMSGSRCDVVDNGNHRYEHRRRVRGRWRDTELTAIVIAPAAHGTRFEPRACVTSRDHLDGRIDLDALHPRARSRQERPVTELSALVVAPALHAGSIERARVREADREALSRRRWHRDNHRKLGAITESPRARITPAVEPTIVTARARVCS